MTLHARDGLSWTGSLDGRVERASNARSCSRQARVRARALCDARVVQRSTLVVCVANRTCALKCGGYRNDSRAAVAIDARPRVAVSKRDVHLADEDAGVVDAKGLGL